MGCAKVQYSLWSNAVVVHFSCDWHWMLMFRFMRLFSLLSLYYFIKYLKLLQCKSNSATTYGFRLIVAEVLHGIIIKQAVVFHHYCTSRCSARSQFIKVCEDAEYKGDELLMIGDTRSLTTCT